MGWLLLVTVIRSSSREDGIPMPMVIGAVVFVLIIVFVVMFATDRAEANLKKLKPKSDQFDPYAGGYPVPPMPGQQLPELAGLIPSTLATDDAPGVPVPSRRAANEGDI
jgi:NADH-quinone oxidoreductase subunit H